MDTHALLWLLLVVACGSSTGSGRAECGDALVEWPEECDGGGETADCDIDCTRAVCGDGTANHSAGEHCDSPDRRLCSGDCQLVFFVDNR